MRDGVGAQEVTISFLRDEVSQAQQATRDFKKKMAKLMIDKEHSDLALVRLEKKVANLKRDKQSTDLAGDKFQEVVTELKRKENLVKKLAIDKFKASAKYKEDVEASAY